MNIELDRQFKLKADLEPAEHLEAVDAQLRAEAAKERENPPAKGAEEEDRSTMGLIRTAEAHLGKVEMVAGKSKNLKGPFIKSLRDSVTAMKGIVGTLASRSTNDEMSTLSAANQRLTGQVQDLINVVGELRRRLDSPPSPPEEGRTARPVCELRRKTPATQPEEEMEVDQWPALVTSTPREPPPKRLTEGWTEGPTQPPKVAEGDSGMEILLNTVLEKVSIMVQTRLEPIMGRLLPEKTLRFPLRADGGWRLLRCPFLTRRRQLMLRARREGRERRL